MGQKRYRDVFVWDTVTDSDDETEELKLEHVEHVDQESRVHIRGGTAILRLPAETLAEIFKLSQLVNQNDESDPDWCWITVTHICRYWRDIALNTQGLWTHLDISGHASPEQTDVYLQRSGTAPLDVYYNGRGINSSAHRSLCLALHHIHRVRILHILRIEHLEDLYELMEFPAPLLEMFSLKTISKDVHDIRAFFGGQAPKLTTLSLYTKPYTLENVTMMRNLKRLTLCLPLDLIELFSIISQNTKYEELSVSSLRSSDKRFEAQSPITMPSLEELAITSARHSVLSELFKNVEFPSLDQWYIHCEDFPLRMGEIADHKGIIPRTSYIGAFSLQLIIFKTSIQIIASSLDNENDELQRHRNVLYSWRFFGREIYTDGFKFAGSVIGGDFWCAATELIVKVDCMVSKDLRSLGVGSEHWKSVLRVLPHIRKLTVAHVWGLENPELLPSVASTETHYGLLRALGSSPGGNSNGDVVCPKLSELHLSGFDPGDSIRVVLTFDWLANRRKCGKPLSCFV